MPAALAGLFGWPGWTRMAAMATALAAVSALWFSAQSLRATEAQLRLTEQGHLTDRFGRAVEQIGSDKLDVRLGGIYALERLARDSARDHPTVVEVLAAFVRDHAPIGSCVGVTDPFTRPATDVQAALTVIARRDVSRDNGTQVDLSLACLYGAKLPNAQLAGAILQETNLEHAELRGTNLAGAVLRHARLTVARLNDADLTGAVLTGADLEGAALSGADLTGARLDGANVEHTDLAGRDETATGSPQPTLEPTGPPPTR
ncbi:MAG: pentapeptide repeat-containing protein [Saccharothrix sp.]|nr:pentapeptide repeat-containing protein [Saccharothrix sp.]